MRVLLQCSSWAVVAIGLAACDSNPVSVQFTHPFPISAADAEGFLPRHQGQYVRTTDSTCVLLVSSQQLVERSYFTLSATAQQLDSLGLAPRAGEQVDASGQYYRVQALAAGRFSLRWTLDDTLATLTGSRAAILRRYRGWYYLSKPVDHGAWAVERLAVTGRQLRWQQFNPDSLRLRALSPATVGLTREKNQLLFSLNPRPGAATRQVDNYAGLWLPKATYNLKGN